MSTEPRDDESHQVPTHEATRTITSEELLQGARELLIRHGEDVYRLRVTRNGKLILQK